MAAQDLGPVNSEHVWERAVVWDPAWDTAATGSEVLEDELFVRLKNTKPQFFALFFERRSVIRYGSEEDILRHGRFTLPQSLDPLYDARNTPFTERHEPARPHWFNVRLDLFQARIIRPDGTWGEVGAFASVDREEVRTIRTMETAWTYVLDLQALNPGDVVEVRWKYMVPYDMNGNRTAGWRGYEWMDNWSRTTNWRIFFHGELPIRKQRVEITYHLKHGLVLGGEPAHTRTVQGNEAVVRWDHVALAGCMREVNARPAMDLPHIVARLVPEDPRYWQRDRLSGIPVEQPHWMQVARYRASRALWWRRVAQKWTPDRQNNLFKAFVERTVQGLAQEPLARQMEALHEHIAEHFTYEDDRLWFQDLDRGLPRMGDQVNEQRIREISRYDLYAKLASALQADHTTAYILDKRVGHMTDLWTTPLWESDLLVGVRDADDVLWMHPKRAQHGLLAGELPFYLQGTPALLVNLSMLLDDVAPTPLFADLPQEHASASQRVVEYQLKVWSDRTITADARVFLSGQFSTLGRSAYQRNSMDALVDPRYGDVLAPLLGVDTTRWEVRAKSLDAPFRFQAVTTNSFPLPLGPGAEDELTVDLKPLLVHVVPDGFVADTRHLPFYWDLLQHDRSVVELHFEDPIELVNGKELSFEASTGNSSVQRIVQQTGPYEVRVESRFQVTGEREGPEQFVQLEEVIQRVNRNDAVLRVRILPDRP